MNDGLSAAVLALGLQALCCAVLMWVFSRKAETPGLWRVILCSLLQPPIAIATDAAVGGFLREGTLLFTAVLLALLLHTLGKLRILPAFGAVFCLFSVTLGYAVLQHNRALYSEAAEEERLLQQGFDAPNDPTHSDRAFPRELLDSRLDRSLLLARNHLHAFLYSDDSSLTPPSATPTPAAAAATPLPTLRPDGPSPDTIPGEEFALLFLPAPADATPVPRSPQPSPTPTLRPEKRGDNVVNVNTIPAITAEQLTQMAKVRNLSIDRRYPAPIFEVGLVGIGDAGSYAMINGNVIRIGGIVRSSDGKPSAWKLVKVSATELYWQPME